MVYFSVGPGARQVGERRNVKGNEGLSASGRNKVFDKRLNQQPAAIAFLENAVSTSWPSPGLVSLVLQAGRPRPQGQNETWAEVLGAGYG